MASVAHNIKYDIKKESDEFRWWYFHYGHAFKRLFWGRASMWEMWQSIETNNISSKEL